MTHNSDKVEWKRGSRFNKQHFCHSRYCCEV